MSPPYHELVQDLMNFVGRDPVRLDDFHKAIQTAKDPKNGGDHEMFLEGINTLGDYYRYCDDLLQWIPRVDTEGDGLLRKLLVFYWIFNQPDVDKYQTQIIPENSGADPTWLSYWQVIYAREIGHFLDTRESACGIKTFYENPLYNHESSLWQDPPPGGWASFNQFFARKWKDIDVARPLTDEDAADDVIVSIADSKFGETFPVINGKVTIKGFDWTIEKLLRRAPGDFDNGSFMHAFLGPTDYHRQHAPVSGTVIEAKVIQELVYLQVTKDPEKTGLAADRGLVVKKPLVVEKRLRDLIASGGKKLKFLLANGGKTARDLAAPDDPGYQWCQTRGLIVIQTEAYGKVAVLPIGMAHVSSVVLSVEKGQTVEKGQEISYFQFGGSDVVLVFENGVEYSAQFGQKCNVRTRVATFVDDPTS
ncbi:putative phosphatidylserine decarboxylase [Rostrohypoxylon terebratum]|nr:putative phosphatidylserine decarboxylase [Rostrohypoxylon terebratum]